VRDGLLEVTAHPGGKLDCAGVRTAQSLCGCAELGESCPGSDTERRNPHHSFQPELRCGRHPIGQRLEMWQRAAATRRVAVQAGLDEHAEGAAALPGLPRGTGSSIQGLNQSGRIHRLHLHRPLGHRPGLIALQSTDHVPAHPHPRTQRDNLSHLGGGLGVSGLSGVEQAKVSEQRHVACREGLGDREQPHLRGIPARGGARGGDAAANPRQRRSQLVAATYDRLLWQPRTPRSGPVTPRSRLVPQAAR
jgi:hypothetical protein